jgi:UDP-2,3-diacylglucosamine pyrophosphatase LpxH
MVKKYHNVFITGDTHLGDAVFSYEDKLVESIKRDNFDAVVFGGDTFDPWRGTSSEDLVVRYKLLFKFLQKLKTKVVFIKGNHDPEIDFLKKMGFSVKKKFKYVGSLGEKIKVIHGHEFDDACRRWEFLTSRIAYLENKINQCLMRSDKESFVRFINLINKIDVKRVLSNFRQRVGHYSNVDALVFGHTHLPMTEEKEKVKIYNWGGWQKDFGLNPHYLVHKAGKFSNIDVK